MKKRILAALCAAVLTVALPLTAMAAPSVSGNYALLPSADGKTAANYTQAKVSVVSAGEASADVKVGTVNTVFMPGVLTAISECFGTTTTVYDVSKLAVKKAGVLTLNCNLASAQDKISVLFYNTLTGAWEEVPAAVVDGQIAVSNVKTEYSFFVIMNKGQN